MPAGTATVRPRRPVRAVPRRVVPGTPPVARPVVTGPPKIVQAATAGATRAPTAHWRVLAGTTPGAAGAVASAPADGWRVTPAATHSRRVAHSCPGPHHH
ncbi:hypothetical protein, partial [Streptomyces sp. MB09-02B]|uniref:hypothetical protein n=1 Tax=Streptomyces sp. MB09-02B TaxID=3028667 RepID=UPI0029BFA722